MVAMKRKTGILEGLRPSWLRGGHSRASKGSRTSLLDLDGNIRFEAVGDVSAVLEEAIRRGVTLDRLDLRGADLRGVRIVATSKCEWVYLDGADLSSADLRGARIERANLVGAKFVESRLSGAVIRSVNAMRADLRRADLSGSQLTLVGMSDVVADGADLSGCRMDTVGLSGASLVRASLARTRLKDMAYSGGFNRADLAEADMNAMEAEGPVPFIKATLNGANLSAACLREAVFLDASLDHCSMAYADLQGARFERAHCVGMDATGADLRSAVFMDANLDFGVLEGADLRQAKMLMASAEQLNANGALLDGASVRSDAEGIDPLFAGGRNVR